MALLQEDTSFTHIIAIGFGTGTSGYAITPKLLENGKARIEVFSPSDESDDQKTSTVILFDKEYNCLAFGQSVLQRYAELIDDGDTALLFQTHKMHLLHMHTNAIAVDGREMPLTTV